MTLTKKSAARKPRGVALVPFALLALGATLFFVAVSNTDMTRSSSFGSITLVPFLGWVGFLTVTGTWAYVIVCRTTTALVRTVSFIVGTFTLYGFQPFASGQVRGPINWIHYGFIDYIARSGTTALSVDARFSWPGFFSGWGLLSASGSIGDFEQLMMWFPVAIALMLGGLTYVLGRELNFTARVSSIAATILSVANWIEQDYFAPQGLTHLAALLVLILILRILHGQHRILGSALVSVLIVSLVITHQLTPFMLGLSLLVLLFTRHRDKDAVPYLISWILILAACQLAWFTIGAQEFFTQSARSMFASSSGPLNSTTNFLDRFSGAQVGILVARFDRIFMTLLLVGGVAAGLFTKRISFKDNLEMILLAVVPFSAMFVQSYGGEIYMRALLFGLPFLSLLLAQTFENVTRTPKSARRIIVPRTTEVFKLLIFTLTLIFFATNTLFLRGGNDGFYYAKPSEFPLAQQAINDTRTTGSVFVLHSNGSIGAVDLLRHWVIRPVDCPSEYAASADMVGCIGYLRPDTVIITASMVRAQQLTGNSVPTTLESTINGVVTKGYRVSVYEEAGTVLTRVTEPASKPYIARPISYQPHTTQAIALALCLIVVATSLTVLRRRPIVFTVVNLFILAAAAALWASNFMGPR